jgi:alpha-tubulin suppressor-like RCC1 family protein
MKQVLFFFLLFSCAAQAQIFHVDPAAPPAATAGVYVWGAIASSVNAAHGINEVTPVKISDKVPSVVSVSFGHGLMIFNGELWVWGDQQNGRLGNGATTAAYAPIFRVGSETDWTHVSAGISQSYAIRAGRLYVTGLNANGQLGTGNTTQVTTWTQIGSDTNWQDVKAGSSWALAIKGGSLFTTGLGTDFRTGLNATTQVETWTLASNAETFTEISAGALHGIAIGGGKLYSWGSNANGRTGQGTTTGSTQVPTQVGSDTNWAKCAAGANHSICTRTTGTLWAFGAGTNGRLGTGNITQQTSPTQAGSDTDWSDVKTTWQPGQNSYAKKTNGHLYGCGSDGYGQLFGLGSYGLTNSTMIQLTTYAVLDYSMEGHGIFSRN